MKARVPGRREVGAVDGLGLEGRSPTTQRAWKASMFTVQRRGFLAPEVRVSTREAPSAERRAPVAGAQDREWERGPLCRLCTRPGGQGGTGDG